jgi:hypothetical protein
MPSLKEELQREAEDKARRKAEKAQRKAHRAELRVIKAARAEASGKASKPEANKLAAKPINPWKTDEKEKVIPTWVLNSRAPTTTTNAAGVRKLCQQLDANDLDLVALSLPSKNIQAAGAGRLANALRTNVVLASLDLRSNPLTTLGVQRLCEGIQVNDTLRELNMRNCGIDNAGAQHIIACLQNNKTLVEVDLRQNNITTSLSRIISDHIAANCVEPLLIQMRENSPSCTSPDFPRYTAPFGDVGARRIAEALRGNTSVTSLRIWSKGIGDAGAKALAAAMAEEQGATAPLRELNLQNNNVSDIGASSLASTLATNSTLKVLRLWSNNLTARGEQTLERAFKGNPDSALEVLDITGTEGTGDEEWDAAISGRIWKGDDDSDDEEGGVEEEEEEEDTPSVLAPPPPGATADPTVDPALPWANLSPEQLRDLLVEFKRLGPEAAAELGQ